MVAAPVIPYTLGPWLSGLNVRDMPDDLDPHHASELINFDPETDGSITPRRAFTTIPTGTISPTIITYVGSYKWASGTYSVFWDNSGKNLYVKSNADAPSALPTAIHFAVGLSGTFTTCFLYKNNLYILSNSTADIYVLPVNTSGIPTGFVSNFTTLPANLAGVGGWQFVGMIKERMFIVAVGSTAAGAPANRVFWSKATDPTTWAAPDGGFFDAESGVGFSAWAIIVNNLYLFKPTQSFVFSFTSDPGNDGNLVKVNPAMGGDACVVYQNSLYVYNADGVFLFQNNSFHRLSTLIDRYLRVRRSVNFSPFYDINKHALVYMCSLIVLDKTLVLLLPSYTGVSNLPASGSVSFFAMNIETNAWSEHQVKGSFTTTDEIQALGRSNSTSGELQLFLTTNASNQYAYAYMPVIKDRTIYKADSFYQATTLQWYIPKYSVLSNMVQHVYNRRLRRFIPFPTVWKRLKFYEMEGIWDLPQGIYTVNMQAWVDPTRDISIVGAVPYVAGRIEPFNQPITAPDIVNAPNMVNRLSGRSFRFRKFLFQIYVSQQIYGADPTPAAPHLGKPFFIQSILCNMRPGSEISD